MPQQIERSTAETIINAVDKAKESLPSYASTYSICKRAGVVVQDYRNARFTVMGPNTDV